MNLDRRPTGDSSETGRVLFLLAAIVAFVALLPASDRMPRLWDLAESAMIVSAVAVCGTRRWAMWTAIGLGVPALGLSWVGQDRSLDVLNGLGALITVSLYVLVLVLMLRRVFRARVASLETVLLAVGSYLMTAVVWSLGYIVVEMARPGSFSCFADLVHDPGWQRELVYFSFVTMTTLGYGDIVPVTAAARSLAMLEAVTGTMFLGVLIAGLVGRMSSSGGRD